MASLDYKEHFSSFIKENPSATFEEWIDAMSNPQGSTDAGILLDFEGMSKVIDPKYYKEDCDERKFWNDNIADSGRTEVRALTDESLNSSSVADVLGDFMSDSGSETGKPEVDPSADLMSFD